MTNAARLGDKCTGHGAFPPRPNNQGSPDVFINSLAAHRKGDSYQAHCDPSPSCHASVLAGGSSSVFINGKEAGRIGDVVACGGVVAEGSPNVIIGS